MGRKGGSGQDPHRDEEVPTACRVNSFNKAAKLARIIEPPWYAKVRLH